LVSLARLVGPGIDPGLYGFALAALLEALHKFVEPTTEDPPGASAAEAQLRKQATNTAVRLCSGFILPASTEHFGNLVPILVARDREQSQ
jgi:hypothetical protein